MLEKISSKCKNIAPTEAYTTPIKITHGATKCLSPKSSNTKTISDFEAELSTNSGNSISKLDSLENLGIPNLFSGLLI